MRTELQTQQKDRYAVPPHPVWTAAHGPGRKAPGRFPQHRHVATVTNTLYSYRCRPKIVGHTMNVGIIYRVGDWSWRLKIGTWGLNLAIEGVARLEDNLAEARREEVKRGDCRLNTF